MKAGLRNFSPKQQALLEAMLAKEREGKGDAAAIRPRNRKKPALLSAGQERLWLFDQLNPRNPAYNVPQAWRIQGPLNVWAMEQSLRAIMDRHEVLRTTIAERDGNRVQIVQESGEIRFEEVDLRRLPASERECQARTHIQEEAESPFDLQRGPLLRAKVFCLNDGDFIFLMNVPHIAFDGWSHKVFLKEFAMFYGLFSTGKEAELKPLPIQYADYATWQSERINRPELDQQAKYWKEKLSGEIPTLLLPTDRPRPPAPTFRGITDSFSFSPSLAEKIKERAAAEGVTLFVFLLAAFKALLYRLAGQKDILIGLPFAGRDRAELENLIGFFINTVVLRTDLENDPSFRELLHRVRETSLGAYENQEIPFQKLVEIAQGSRSANRSPLYQVMFVFQNEPERALQLPGLTVEAMAVDNGAAKCDLTFSVLESGALLTGTAEYNSDLFDKSRMERFVEYYKIILESAAQNTEQTISRLPILPSREKTKILSEWNDTGVDQFREKCLPYLIEEQAERTPDAIALRFENQAMTYRELNARANQLARCLRSHGAGPDVMVGVSMLRSLEMVVALVGILKAGAAYVPIDPSYPEDRIAFMLRDANVPVLITQPALRNHLPAGNSKIISLESTWTAIESFDSGNPARITKPEHLAYTIYTSGSTGMPKGAMNTHEGVCNRLLWGQASFPLTSADRLLQKTPFSFDVSVWEFFWPLISGATLVMARPDGHRDPAYLVRTIQDEKITTIHFVPSMLHAFLQERSARDCASIRHVFCSGEALPFELQQRFFSIFKCPLYNLYGPTEASVEVTYHICDRASEVPIVPIGRPVANTEMYVLDQHLQPVPIGAAAELHIGGIGVARGYHNREELTREKFIPDPFHPGRRLYKTGDLARFRPDGNIEYLGRIDHQVKIRGFRIELGEIETRLLEFPAILEAVVVAHEVNADKRLVAYLAPRPGASISTDELRAFLLKQLPDYMVPTAFVILEKLPLNPNGKVDRRALPAPELSLDASRDEFVAPRNSTEEALARIWQEVLGLPRIGVHDNFFRLGGHSLFATQIVSRIRSDLRLEMPLLRIFEVPTIAGLASSVAEARPHAEEMSMKPLLTDVNEYSDEEVDKLLNSLLPQ